MLKVLRKLFAPAPDQPANANAKITLTEVMRSGWLDLWYQPKIDLRTMRLVGAEGLARARHPERGVMPPGVFLADAREDELLELTERVIIAALRDWELFHEYGVPIKLAVNVPVSAFLKLPIARMLRDGRPREAEWPGLVLEVTEDEIINDLPLAKDVALSLRENHCSLALDDFGAGYSTLARLRELPFDELKIDRSYVSNCNSDRINAGLCETIVELGKRCGLTTIAEGIETNHESHKLRGIGCDVGQGYLFAKPMPKGQLIGLMRKRVVREHKETLTTAPVAPAGARA